MKNKTEKEIINILKTEFKQIKDVFDVNGKHYSAFPFFYENEFADNDMMVVKRTIEGVTFKIKEYSPMSISKRYAVAYQIVEK
jgi:hypothetical protein